MITFSTCVVPDSHCCTAPLEPRQAQQCCRPWTRQRTRRPQQRLSLPGHCVWMPPADLQACAMTRKCCSYVLLILQKQALTIYSLSTQQRSNMDWDTRSYHKCANLSW